MNSLSAQAVEMEYLLDVIEWLLVSGWCLMMLFVLRRFFSVRSKSLVLALLRILENRSVPFQRRFESRNQWHCNRTVGSVLYLQSHKMGLRGFWQRTIVSIHNPPKLSFLPLELNSLLDCSKWSYQTESALSPKSEKSEKYLNGPGRFDTIRHMLYIQPNKWSTPVEDSWADWPRDQWIKDVCQLRHYPLICV